MIVAALLLVLSGLAVPVIGLRGRGRLAWTAFKTRRAGIDALLLCIVVGSLDMEMAQVCLRGIGVICFANVSLFLAQIPAFFLARRFGYQIAFFRDHDNWSKPKR